MKNKGFWIILTGVIVLIVYLLINFSLTGVSPEPLHETINSFLWYLKLIGVVIIIIGIIVAFRLLEKTNKSHNQAQ